MTSGGVIKVRSYAQKPEEERWKAEELEKGKGVPWEPILGRGHIQVKTRVGILSGVEAPKDLEDPVIKDTVVKRIYIYKETGCKGLQPIHRMQGM